MSDDFRHFYRKQLNVARRRRSKLGPQSHVGIALTESILDEVSHQVESRSEIDLEYAHWPFIFGFVVTTPVNVIREFDADAELVIANSASSQRQKVTRFLGSRASRTGEWYGGLLEIWAKSSCLKRGKKTELDVAVAGGRDHDISALIGSRRFHFECTVLTQDDESREVWDRFIADKKLDPRKVLIRPGEYCPPNAKGPNPYYTAFRIYAKAFDKLTKKLDPSKSQFNNDEPNILLTSLAGPGVSSNDPGVRWGFEELFANNPKFARTVMPESFTDISLDAWSDFTAKELIAHGKMSREWYCEKSGQTLSAPRQLGGALIFQNSKLAGSRVNYNAHDSCKISHSEIAQIERLLSRPARYL